MKFVEICCVKKYNPGQIHWSGWWVSEIARGCLFGRCEHINDNPSF